MCVTPKTGVRAHNAEKCHLNVVDYFFRNSETNE